MKKEQLKYVRIIAIILSCLVASLTLCNLLTVATHSIEFEIPEESDFMWAIGPDEKELLLLTEFSVSNHGAYDIDDIDINAKLLTENGQEWIDFAKNDLVVARGSSKSFDIIVTLALEDTSLIDWLSLLYKDTVLRLVVDIDANYMFGLIHFTVDEVLEYPWSAPLANLIEDDSVIPEIFSVLAIAGQGTGYDIQEIMETLTHIDIRDFEYRSDWGYSILLNTSTDSSRNLKNISCRIEVPIKGLDGKLVIGFRVLIGLPRGQVFARLQEVNVSYVK